MTMPEKTPNKNKKKRMNRRRDMDADKSPQRPHEIHRRELPEGIETVQGVYASRTEAEDALTELKGAGFRKSDISVSYVATENDRQGVFGTAAGVIGGALALSSMVVAAPIIFTLQALGVMIPYVGVKPPVLLTVTVHDNDDAAKHATEVLLRTGGCKVSSSGQYEENDLKRREYRDEVGQIHHHTHTYMRDHPDELRRSAA